MADGTQKPGAPPWFRFYTETVYDRKLRRSRVETRWLFVTVLCLARKSPRPGWLMLTVDVPVGWDDLTDAAAMPRKSVERSMADLIDLGMVDLEGATWFVPSWEKRQYESDVSTTRVKRFRERQRNVSETDQSQRQKTETETEPSNSLSPTVSNALTELAERDTAKANDVRNEQAYRLACLNARMGAAPLLQRLSDENPEWDAVALADALELEDYLA